MAPPAAAQPAAVQPAVAPVPPAAPRMAAAPVSPAPAAAGAPARPAALAGPRGGLPDDLKRIRGVGPKLEAMCHRLGFYHFDQIAAWTPAEVAWVDDHLEGFRGRVTRDDWVAQAQVLAAGGDTDFSRRVDDGAVY
jgi:predicted flap endonuclease-1-like 5' DNA nuclease